MKKTFAIAMIAMILTGCASTGGETTASSTINTVTNIGTAVFQTAVNQKCQSEIKANQYYKVASIIMTDEQKNSITTKVCGCVSEKAPQSVSMGEVATAVIDTSSRPQIVAKAVSNTLQACVSEFIK